MLLSSAQTDKKSLSAFGQEASTLLIRHDYLELANRFGYVLANGREPALMATECNRAGVILRRQG
jgi:hypothetical protein